jgi:hypothetical protein
MQLKSAKPKSPLIHVRWLLLIPAIASLLVALWCVWSILPYFLGIALGGLIFQLSLLGMEPLLPFIFKRKS